MANLPPRSLFTQAWLDPCPVPADDPNCPICCEPFTPTAVSMRWRAISFTTHPTVPMGPATSLCGLFEYPRVPQKIACCGKVFCHSCLQIWFATANTCPTCRAEVYDRSQIEYEYRSSEDGDDYDGEEGGVALADIEDQQEDGFMLGHIEDELEEGVTLPPSENEQEQGVALGHIENEQEEGVTLPDYENDPEEGVALANIDPPDESDLEELEEPDNLPQFDFPWENEIGD